MFVYCGSEFTSSGGYQAMSKRGAINQTNPNKLILLYTDPTVYKIRYMNLEEVK